MLLSINLHIMVMVCAQSDKLIFKSWPLFQNIAFYRPHTMGFGFACFHFANANLSCVLQRDKSVVEWRCLNSPHFFFSYYSRRRRTYLNLARVSRFWMHWIGITFIVPITLPNPQNRIRNKNKNRANEMILRNVFLFSFHLVRFQQLDSMLSCSSSKTCSSQLT
jgi:hypothetical protein